MPSGWNGICRSQMKNKHGILHRKRTALGLLIALVPILFFGISPIGKNLIQSAYSVTGLKGMQPLEEYPVNVFFLDVGKADAILICLERTNILIDTGTYASGSEVKTFLKRAGVERLDALFLSHPDSDHIGGAAEILQSFPVEVCFMPDLPVQLYPASAEYVLLASALEMTDTEVRYATAGDHFSYQDVQLAVLGPAGDYANTNDYSIVLKLSVGQIRFLFCGDMEAFAEEDLVLSGTDLSCDVLKVAHHGSRTSSTEAFLNEAKATYAVVSTGFDRNNLPNLDIMNRLEDLGSQVYRTDLHGTIHMATDGKKILIDTEEEKNDEAFDY